MPSTVAVQEVRTYDSDRVEAALRAALEALGGNGIGDIVRPGQTVLLKPNILQGAPPEKAITTHPSVLRAMIRVCRAAGARVWVGENPGVGNPAQLARKAGILAVVEEEGAAWIDLTEQRTFELPDNRIARRIELPRALDEIDALITLPKLKTHGQLAFTGAVKNQFGLIPGTRKARYHYRLETREWLARLMVDINRIVRPALAVMDGIVAMEGLGPSGGRPREVGVLLAGTDPTAVDVVACHLIGLDPRDVPTIRAAAEAAYGETKLANIAVRAMAAGSVRAIDLDTYRVADFELVREIASVLRILPLPPAAQQWIRRQWQPRPRILQERCIECQACVQGCPIDPPAIDPGALYPGALYPGALDPPAIDPGALASSSHAGTGGVNDDTCIRCYCCHEFCPEKAIDLRPGRFAWLFRPLERL
jgi:uncharacterized protein (DUF362 family)/Pyruvate/2-oxoacid:ferredoxin oxidoreductase delta subunit